MLELIDRKGLLAELKTLEPFNNSDVPKWVIRVIEGTRMIKCEDCVWWHGYYCAKCGQIKGKESICEDWRKPNGQN